MGAVSLIHVMKCKILSFFSPFVCLPPENPEALHLLTEVLVLVPEQAIVPQDSHQLIGLLHCGVISDISRNHELDALIIKQI